LKILILAPAPSDISPGQRFRFEHYLPINSDSNLEFTVSPFFSRRTWKIIHLNKNYLNKTLGILSAIIRRVLMFFTVFKYDYIYIYREAAAVGPPVIEWLLAKVFRKRIIYDFDDAIWLRLASEANPFWADIKCSWKVKMICSYSYIITVGNSFLAKYAGQYCSDVRIIPTVVDTEFRHNILKDHSDYPLFVGWTGTFTNFPNLQKIIPVIAKLKKNYSFNFLIIADRNPNFTGVEYDYIPWDIKTEIRDLLNLHIGLMPLANTERELGKCAFKAIQYMSLGITAVVSPVGANCDVVQDNLNGFWADGDDQWYLTIEKLILNKKLRDEIEITSRQKIVENYSVNATKSDFFALFT
jgi:glycosyltransferase involved in cell wall biosynthesis